MPALLFEPLPLRGVTLQNRIIVAPMTQFSANDGVAGDWHLMHLGQFAVSGAALVLPESTYVAAEARNTPACLSLYTDEQEAAVKRIGDFFSAHGSAVLGVQLCHGGRHAGMLEPWKGGGPRPMDQGGHTVLAPSAIPLEPDWPAPRALTRQNIAEVIQQFADAAIRAQRAGVRVIELHGAHGYLIHQFLSPVSNRRDDDYGGSLANRMRFPLEVFEAVRAVWPDDNPIGMRVSATDWIDGGWTVAETIILARALDTAGCDYIHVSSGGMRADQKIDTGPGYQTGFAAAVKAEVSMAVVAVGEISEPLQAETILRTRQADAVALARPMLFNPHWPMRAAQELGADITYPRQYQRGHPARWGAAGLTAPGNRVQR